MKKIKKKKYILLAVFLLICTSVVLHFSLAEEENDDVSNTTQIAIDDTNFPDENFRDVIKMYDKNNNSNLDSTELNSVLEMDIQRKNIKSLKGIEHFFNLRKLDASENALASLDLTEVKNLQDVNLANQKIDVWVHQQYDYTIVRNAYLHLTDYLSSEKDVTNITHVEQFVLNDNLEELSQSEDAKINNGKIKVSNINNPHHKITYNYSVPYGSDKVYNMSVNMYIDTKDRLYR